jgi:hypothetical protein
VGLDLVVQKLRDGESKRMLAQPHYHSRTR